METSGEEQEEIKEEREEDIEDEEDERQEKLDETQASEEDIGRLTDRLLGFSQNVTNLSEEQTQVIRRAAVMFYKQLLDHSHSRTLNEVENQSGEICRICRESGSTEEDLLTPCSCKGTMRSVHLSCLERWLAESDTTRCEICHHEYHVLRTPKFSRLQSIPLWFQSPPQWSERHELSRDAFLMIFATPLAILGTYLSIVGVNTWFDANSTNLTPISFIILSCFGFIGALDTAYFSWVLLRLHYHISVWHHWYRQNSVVKVILPPDTQQPPTEECSQSDSTT